MHDSPRAEERKPSLATAVLGVWGQDELRRRVLVIAVLVGSSVTLAHQLLGSRLSFAAWTFVHALLPAVVFTSGAAAAGARRANASLIARGLATVVVVTVGFTLINSFATLPFWAILVLNLLVPATVSTLGAAATS